MTDDRLLSARGLHKTYRLSGATLRVLQGVDLDLQRGERVAVTGASGSGKSTLLHLLGGLDRPDQGQVVLKGEDLFAGRRGLRARRRAEDIGFVFQSYHLFPELSVLENVQLAMSACPGRRFGDRTSRQRAEKLLGEVGLADRMLHRPVELSGGEQQRVALVRAMMNEPQLVLADEPTGNLDAATGEAVLEAMFGLGADRRCGMVLVTHDPAIAARCDRHLHLEEGRLAPGEQGKV